MFVCLMFDFIWLLVQYVYEASGASGLGVVWGFVQIDMRANESWTCKGDPSCACCSLTACLLGPVSQATNS